MLETRGEPLDLRPFATSLEWLSDTPVSLPQMTMMDFFDTMDVWPWPSLRNLNFENYGHDAVILVLPPLVFSRWAWDAARDFLDSTAEFWSLRAGRVISREQARECVTNITGFVKVLAGWVKAAKNGTG